MLGAAAVSALAEVTYDGTFNTNANPAFNGITYTILDTDGMSAGPNLFFSFDQFNLISGQNASFTPALPGSLAPANVLVRVTGGASTINDGVIRSTLGESHFFLMNPAGITFISPSGLNPSRISNIDVGGSFTATTADYIGFGEGNPNFEGDPVRDMRGMNGNVILSAANPVAFGFLSNQPAGLGVTGPGTLNVESRNSVNLIAGDIALAGRGGVNAPSGQATLVSVASTGEVRFDPSMIPSDPDTAGFSGLGEIHMNQGTLLTNENSDGFASGRVVIRGGKLTMIQRTDIQSVVVDSPDSGGGVSIVIEGELTMADRSQIATLSFSPGDAGPIEIEAGSIEMTGSRVFSRGGFGGGRAGDISVTAGRLAIDGLALNLGDIESASLGPGNSGNVKVDVAGRLDLVNSAVIRSSTRSTGNAGDIDVHAGELVIDGRDNEFITGIAAQSNAEGPNPGGNSGGIDITVDGAVSIFGGGRITTNTNNNGLGGEIVLEAGSIFIDAADTTRVTGITADATENATGRGGSIDITTPGPIELVRGGTISASTGREFDENTGSLLGGRADGGDITIRAGSITAARMGSLFRTGILTLSRGVAGPTGDGGDIDVMVAGSLTLTDGAEIDAGTFGSGSGGGVRATAGSVYIDRAGNPFSTGISAASRFLPGAAPGTGPGGFVSVSADTVTLRNGGLISAGTVGGGRAGDVSVSANSIDVSGKGTPGGFVFSDSSAIVAGTREGSTGDGGSVKVAGASITVSQEGLIGANTGGAGDAGIVEVTAGVLEVSHGGEIGSRSSAKGNAGSVAISSLSDVNLMQGGRVAVDSPESNAGSVTVRADRNLNVNQSSVTAFAGIDGGSIDLSAADRITINQSEILAEAGNDGGDILIRDAVIALANRSRISANAILGTGGNILVTTDVFLANESFITASSQFGAEGSVRVDAQTDLSGTAAELASDFIDVTDQLQPRCSVRVPGGSGSFIIVGRGGLPVIPGQFLPSLRVFDLPREE